MRARRGRRDAGSPRRGAQDRRPTCPSQALAGRESGKTAPARRGLRGVVRVNLGVARRGRPGRGVETAPARGRWGSVRDRDGRSQSGGGQVRRRHSSQQGKEDPGTAPRPRIEGEAPETAARSAEARGQEDHRRATGLDHGEIKELLRESPGAAAWAGRGSSSAAIRARASTLQRD